MTASDYDKLGPEGKILANELMYIKQILLQLRDGVQAIEGEYDAK